jgi:hypothetical protein
MPNCSVQPQVFDKAPRREFFVQKVDTNVFLDDLGMWTANRAEARRFNTSLDAIVCCLVRKYSDVQIVGTLNWPGVPDITIPVKSAGAESCVLDPAPDLLERKYN